MNASSNRNWNPDFNLDGFASIAVLAATVLIVLLAALAPNVDAAPKATQVVSIA